MKRVISPVASLAATSGVLLSRRNAGTRQACQQRLIVQLDDRLARRLELLDLKRWPDILDHLEVGAARECLDHTLARRAVAGEQHLALIDIVALLAI
jgi:hypothetical protein